MRHRAIRALPAFALVLAIGMAVGGCATATAGASSVSSAPSSAATTARASTPAYGPPAPDPACAAALKARQTLEARQGKDQSNESAIDQDFMNFANALSTAASQEKHPATAKAMNDLANDYTALVQSQSGAEQLPDVSTVQSDGAAFDKACPLSLTRDKASPAARTPDKGPAEAVAGISRGSRPSRPPFGWCISRE